MVYMISYGLYVFDEVRLGATKLPITCHPVHSQGLVSFLDYSLQWT